MAARGGPRRGQADNGEDGGGLVWRETALVAEGGASLLATEGPQTGSDSLGDEASCGGWRPARRRVAAEGRGQVRPGGGVAGDSSRRVAAGVEKVCHSGVRD
jgi:hypothetical protein